MNDNTTPNHVHLPAGAIILLVGDKAYTGERVATLAVETAHIAVGLQGATVGQVLPGAAVEQTAAVVSIGNHSEKTASRERGLAPVDWTRVTDQNQAQGDQGDVFTGVHCRVGSYHTVGVEVQCALARKSAANTLAT